MKGLILYLIIGMLLSLALEFLWDRVADEEDGPYAFQYRLLMVLFWPLVLIAALYYYYINNDDDGTPGYGY